MSDPCKTCGAYPHPYTKLLRKKDEEIGDQARKITALRATVAAVTAERDSYFRQLAAIDKAVSAAGHIALRKENAELRSKLDSVHHQAANVDILYHHAKLAVDTAERLQHEAEHKAEALATKVAEWEQTAQDCDSGNICINCGQVVP